MADRVVEVQYLRPSEILEERDRSGLVYLPLGPLEWHGPHLPVGTDPLRAMHAAVGLARRLGGVVMPALYLGTERERSPGMLGNIGLPPDAYVVGMDFPGNALKSLYAREEVFALVLREHLELLVDTWGFRRLVIVNGHGAENHLAVIERLRREVSERTSARIVAVMPMDGFPDGGWGHATLEETQTLQVFHPHAVDLGSLPPAGRSLLNTEWAIVDDQTFRGRPTPRRTVRPEEDPRGADGDEGRRQFERTVEALAAYLRRELGLP